MFVIGDVHGRLDLLEPLYKEISKHGEQVYAVGDLIDRGDNPIECLQFCKKNNIICIRGNHEQFLIDYFTKDNSENDSSSYLWLYNGGFTTLDSLYKSLSENEIIDLVNWIKTWPLCIINHKEKYILFHAGPKEEFHLGMEIQEFMNIAKNDVNFLWNKGAYVNNPTLSMIPYKLISGHVPTIKICDKIDKNSPDILFNNENKYFVDIGAVFLGTLGALHVKDGNVEPEGYYYNIDKGFYKKKIYTIGKDC